MNRGADADTLGLLGPMGPASLPHRERSIMAKGLYIVGVDLGGTNMQVAVVGSNNRIMGRAKKKTRASEGSVRVLDRLVDGVHEACIQAGISLRDVAVVGVGAPGAVDPKRGVVLEAMNLRWNDFPLAATLSKRLGQQVVVDNDVNCAVYGEYKLGAGKGASEILGVWIGTGVGGGLILNGGLYYGTTFTAGEIGQTILLPGSPPGSRTLENNCSRSAIVDRLVRLIRGNNQSIIPDLAEGDLVDIKARIVAQAYAKGDRLTVQVIKNAAELIGISVANVVTLLGIQRVVIGGGLTESMGESLVSLIREATRANVYPAVCRAVEVVATKLQADAGTLGAAVLARQWLESRSKIGRAPAVKKSAAKASPAHRASPAVKGKTGLAAKASASPLK